MGSGVPQCHVSTSSPWKKSVRCVGKVRQLGDEGLSGQAARVRTGPPRRASDAPRNGSGCCGFAANRRLLGVQRPAPPEIVGQLPRVRGRTPGLPREASRADSPQGGCHARTARRSISSRRSHPYAGSRSPPSGPSFASEHVRSPLLFWSQNSKSSLVCPAASTGSARQSPNVTMRRTEVPPDPCS